MSFRIEEKLYLSPDNLIEFKDFIFKNSGKNYLIQEKLKACILII